MTTDNAPERDAIDQPDEQQAATQTPTTPAPSGNFYTRMTDLNKGRLQFGVPGVVLTAIFLVLWLTSGSTTETPPTETEKPTTAAATQQEEKSEQPTVEPNPDETVVTSVTVDLTPAPEPAKPTPAEQVETGETALAVKSDTLLPTLVGYTATPESTEEVNTAIDVFVTSLSGDYVLAARSGPQVAYKRSNVAQTLKSLTVTRKGIIVEVEGTALTTDQKAKATAIAEAMGLPSSGEWTNNSNTYVFTFTH